MWFWVALAFLAFLIFVYFMPDRMKMACSLQFYYDDANRNDNSFIVNV